MNPTIKHKLRTSLTLAATKLGFSLVPSERRKREEAAMCRLLQKAINRTPSTLGPTHTNGADSVPFECIVFSKDRPLQLSALFASWRQLVDPKCPIHVIYRASHDRYAAAYDELKTENADLDLYWYTEKSFRDDLLQILKNVSRPGVFFLVDDIIFTEPTDLSDFAELDLATHVPSLRLGQNLTQCYTVRASQKLPSFDTLAIGSDSKLIWRWRDGKLDWAYPLSVDGHFFSTDEIRTICSAVGFNSPNTFELALQVFVPCFESRLGVCYPKSRLVNIPCNRIQTDFANYAGNVSEGKLLEHWEAGLAIDDRSLQGLQNVSSHQHFDLKLVSRHTRSF